MLNGRGGIFFREFVLAATANYIVYKKSQSFRAHSQGLVSLQISPRHFIDLVYLYFSREVYTRGPLLSGIVPGLFLASILTRPADHLTARGLMYVSNEF
jgi:hypothetical protein